MHCMGTRLTLFWRNFETFFFGLVFVGSFWVLFWFFFPSQIKESTYGYVEFLEVILFLLAANIKTFMLAI